MKFHLIAAFLLLLLLCLLSESLAQDDSSGDDSVDCKAVHDIDNDTDQCTFVQNSKSCANDGGFVNYIVVLYCDFQGQLRPLVYVLYALWFLYLLLATAVTSDRFFAPNLPVISDALHLSENIAGETLMALGNGAPDVFSALAAALSMKADDAGILYGALLGAGMFVLCVVIGTIIMIRPFHTMERPLLKEMAFYMCGVFCAFATLWDGQIHTWEAAMFLVIYVVYVSGTFVAVRVNSILKERSKKQFLKREADAVKVTIEEVNENDNNGKTDGLGTTAGDRTSISSSQTEGEPKLSLKLDIVHVRFSAMDRSQDGNENRAYVTIDDAETSLKIANSPTLLRRPPTRNSSDSTNNRLPSPPRPSSGSQAGSIGDMVSATAPTAAITNTLAVVGMNQICKPTFRHQHSLSACQYESNARQLEAVSQLQEKKERCVSLGADVIGIKPLQRTPAQLSKSELGGTHTSRIAIRRASSIGKGSIISDRSKSNLKRRPSAVSQSSAAHRNHHPQTAIIGINQQSIIPDNDEIGNIDEQDEMELEIVEDRPFYQWILHGLNPIEMDEWHEEKSFGKLVQVLKAPIIFIMLLTNPVVDEEKQMFNWNRPMNSLHCVISPIFVLLAIQEFGYMIGDVFPLIALFTLIGFVFAFAVYFTSKNTTRPKYHLAFAFLGFASTVIWIYILANEIVNLLQCFGLALNISQTILGLTCLAWGNSLGDLINDTVVARQGYSKMAIASCYGGHTFNVLLGFGLPMLIITLRNGGVVNLAHSNVDTVIFGFLGFQVAVSSVAISLIQKFYVRRPYAIFLYCTYAAFVVCAVLTEIGTIKPDVFSYARTFV